MSFLAIFSGVGVLVWFYLTAKEKGEHRFNWAIVGLIGYWLAWGGAKLVLTISGLVAKGTIMAVIVNQIPVICAIGAAFIVRRKLLSDVAVK
ncbi:MAG: hypothetical protein NTU70_10020 [Methylococcales bacterium]|jgi:hypothetical protein|nr:hypothetical protein [Methylococcales bacterium]